MHSPGNRGDNTEFEWKDLLRKDGFESMPLRYKMRGVVACLIGLGLLSHDTREYIGHVVNDVKTILSLDQTTK